MKKDDFVLTVNMATGKMKMAIPKRIEYTPDELGAIFEGLVTALCPIALALGLSNKDILDVIKAMKAKAKEKMG